MLFERINVKKNERVVVTKRGHFACILKPGSYRYALPAFSGLATERYNLKDPVFRSAWADYLVERRPEVVADHFTVIETSESEIALISVDGMLHQVLLPGKRRLFWRDAAQVSAEVVSVIEEAELPGSMLCELETFDDRDIEAMLEDFAIKFPAQFEP